MQWANYHVKNDAMTLSISFYVFSTDKLCYMFQTTNNSYINKRVAVSFTLTPIKCKSSPVHKKALIKHLMTLTKCQVSLKLR